MKVRAGGGPGAGRRRGGWTRDRSGGSPAVARPGAPGPAGAGSAPAGLPVAAGSAGDGEPGRLLLVEDNDINQTVALGLLSQLGYAVDVAADGVEALELAERNAYDAILMDCQMPRMDGYAATVELRRRPGTRSTPIIAMTAATFAADRQRCFDSGMDDFVAKPVRAASLQATLHRWLSAGAEPGRVPAQGVPQPRTGERAPDRVGAATPATVAGAAGATRPADPDPDPDLDLDADTDTGARSSDAADLRFADADDPRLAGIDERIAELRGQGTPAEVDLVREVVASFLSRTVDLLQRLTLAVAAGDAEAAYLHAHSLAGAGLNLGALKVVQLCRRIEQDATDGDPSLSVARMVELEAELDRARLRLRDLVAAMPDPGAGAGGPPSVDGRSGGSGVGGRPGGSGVSGRSGGSGVDGRPGGSGVGGQAGGSGVDGRPGARDQPGVR